VRGSRGGCEVIGRLSLPRHCTDVRGCITFGKMTNPKPKAIALLSGGIDSTTALALAQRQGFEVYALTFRYGQRHEIEIAAARRVAGALHVKRHEIVEFDLRRFGGSALTDEIAVPKDRTPAELAAGIPVTYVPARNTIFLSARPTSSSASRPWTTADIPTAGRSTSRRSRPWPTWPRGRASRADNAFASIRR